MYIDDASTASPAHGERRRRADQPRRDELVTINELVDIVEDIAGVKLERNYKLDAPKGVRGRNSDNTLIRERLGWEPSTTLEAGLERRTRGSTNS